MDKATENYRAHWNVKLPNFENQRDSRTFAPFQLSKGECSTGAEYFTLMFSDFRWLENNLDLSTIGSYDLNGYGVQGLIKAARLHAGLASSKDSITYDSEAGACFIYFNSIEDACVTAELAQSTFLHDEALRLLVAFANQHGLQDG